MLKMVSVGVLKIGLGRDWSVSEKLVKSQFLLRKVFNFA